MTARVSEEQGREEQIPFPVQALIIELIAALAKAHDTTIEDIMQEYGVGLEVSRVDA